MKHLAALPIVALLVAGCGAATTAPFKLTAATASGTVRTASGAPAVGVGVRAVGSRTCTDTSLAFASGSSTTDSSGRYHISIVNLTVDRQLCIIAWAIRNSSTGRDSVFAVGRDVTFKPEGGAPLDSVRIDFQLP